jgi:hypothetical protein
MSDRLGPVTTIHGDPTIATCTDGSGTWRMPVLVDGGVAVQGGPLTHLLEAHGAEPVELPPGAGGGLRRLVVAHLLGGCDV